MYKIMIGVIIAAAVIAVIDIFRIRREKLVNGEIDFPKSVAGVVGVAAAFL